VIVNNSTNINKTNNRLSSELTELPTTYKVDNPVFVEQKKIKRPKQDSKNPLRAPISE